LGEATDLVRQGQAIWIGDPPAAQQGATP